MNIIFANKNGDSYQKSSQIYLITNTEPTADDNAWAGFEPNFISTSQAQKLVKDDNTLVLNVLSDEIDDNANGLMTVLLKCKRFCKRINRQTLCQILSFIKKCLAMGECLV